MKPTITYGALLGRIIEYRRKQLAVNQDVLAGALGISQSAYSRLEKGQSAMTVQQLRAVAPHVKTTPGQLLTEVEQYAALYQRQGGQIIEDKEESSVGGVLVALGILATILAASK